MILWDVNVWVYAFRSESPLHATARGALTTSLDSGEGFLFCPMIAASFVRLVTNPRIFIEPSEPAEAWRFLDYVETSGNARIAGIDRQAYALFRHLCLTSRATGNDVPDALLAAAAMRYEAELVTADKGLSRFSGVRVRLIT